MSTSKALADRIKEQKELHHKKLARLESDEFKKMTEEYESLSLRLSELKSQIDTVLGGTAQETSAPEKKRETSNRPKISAEDALAKMVELLKNHPEGLSKSKIADDLNIGAPKIEEAFSLGKAVFEPRTRGPKSVIKLKS